jgi:hypothetical protein
MNKNATLVPPAGLDPVAAPPLASSVRDIFERLFSAVSEHGMALPHKMLAEIELISKRGLDPEWQLKQLNDILDRWSNSE